MTVIYRKSVLVKGRPTDIRCFDLGGLTLRIDGSMLCSVSLEDEWFDELADPMWLIQQLQRDSDVRADVLTFWNPLPDPEPRHMLPFEKEEIAVLPVLSHSDW